MLTLVLRYTSYRFPLFAALLFLPQAFPNVYHDPNARKEGDARLLNTPRRRGEILLSFFADLCCHNPIDTSDEC